MLKFGSNDDFRPVHNIIVRFKGAPQWNLRDHVERLGYTKCLVSMSCSALTIVATGSNNIPIKNPEGEDIPVFDGETHIPLFQIYRLAVDYIPK